MIRRTLCALAAASLWAASGAAQVTDGIAQPDVRSYGPRATAPEGYPADYARIVRAGEDEGQLVIYGATDEEVVQPVIADFQSVYPRIRVTYEDLNTTVLYHRFIAETRMGRDTADILWSSAMDQMVSLAGEGYAMTYGSPEKPGLPGSASFKDQVYATNYEPIVFVYNKDQVKEGEVPKTHDDCARLLGSDPARFKGRVVAYDIEKSGIGFLLATQDEAAGKFAAVTEGFGRAGVTLSLTTSAMAEQVASGRALLGYNLLGGYALARSAKRPSLGYVLPSDYTLVISRVMLANKSATHPNAARLWIDYLSSKRGQTVLAHQSGLLAVRQDVAGGPAMAELRRELEVSQRVIAMDATILGGLDPKAYRDFILRWRRAVFPDRAR